MLTLDNVHTYYGDVHILRGVSLNVEAGAVVALLGRNGMGKSTTVHSIIGFTPPRRGTITFKGEALQGRKPNRIAQMGVALVPQGKRIFPSLTVRENLTVGLRRGDGKRAWTLEQIYDLFPVLQKRAGVSGTALSGGEQQMLAIARALMTAPDLILMDEPSEGLAPLLVAQLGAIIRKLRDAGLAILLVEQNLPFALGAADYVYVLNRGEVVYDAPPAALVHDEDVKTRYLGTAI